MSSQQFPRKGLSSPGQPVLKSPPKKMSFWKKALCAILAVLLLFGLLLGYRLYVKSEKVDPDHLPQFIQASFINLDHITSISKFRSGAGHDFNDGTESCLSMKHYFSPNVAVTSSDGSSKLNVHPADDGTDIPIYSPVDGTVILLEDETTPIGKQVHIVPDNAPQFTIRLFHIWETDSIHGAIPGIELGGSHVKAGQQIGVIPATQDVDISVEYGPIYAQHYVSYFDVMPDSLFATYQARGLMQRSDVILTKAYREANPLQCGGSEKDGFIYPANYDGSADYVYLSGYTKPKQEGSSTPTPATTKNPAAGSNQAAGNGVCDDASLPVSARPPGCSK